MAELLPALESRACGWTSSVLALRQVFCHRLGDNLCSCRWLVCGSSSFWVEPQNRTPDSGTPRRGGGASRDDRTPRKRACLGHLAVRLSAGALPGHCDSARSYTLSTESHPGHWVTTRPLRSWGR